MLGPENYGSIHLSKKVFVEILMILIILNRYMLKKDT